MAEKYPEILREHLAVLNKDATAVADACAVKSK